ncbi:MAG TPA: zinc ribbon domain-containing protein, partial [Anaerolineales bacterium]|nr:zinc ribbon domain-containing protein [Anaerolineales bacterium]
PALSQSDSPRSYNYQWVGDYGVDEFILSVQQPVGALDFEVSGPDLGDPAIQADGLTYYTANLGIMEAGEPLDLSLSYTKNSTSLSAESFSQQSAPTTTEPGGGSGLPVWVWVLMGVGGAFLLVGVVYFVRASRSAKRPASAYRTKKQRSSSGGSRSTGKQVFCHQCGEPAESGDKFCRECGTKLRV